MLAIRSQPTSDKVSSRRSFLLLLVGLVSHGATADAGIIDYELVAKPSRLAIVIVPDESRTAFIEAIKIFGVNNHFEAAVAVGPNENEVTIELSSDRISLSAANPFRDTREYHIALYQNTQSVPEWEVDKYWNELKRKLLAVNGVERWLDKK